MDNNNMNGGQSDPNQQMYGGQVNPNQQMYGGQVNPNQQMYGGQVNPNQQMYGGQPDPNQQMYGGQVNSNQQIYGGQMDPNQQMYGGQVNPNQQMYGGQVNPNQQVYGGQPNGPTSGSKKTFNFEEHKNLIILIAAGLVVLFLIVALFKGIFGHGKQSPKAVGKAVASAYEKEKPKALYKLLDTKYISYLEDEYDVDKEDILDVLEDEIDEFVEDMEDWYETGEIKKIKVDIEDVDKEKGSNLKDDLEYLEDEYDIKASQVATVEMEWEVIGKDDDKTITRTITVYKRMGKWYYFDYDLEWSLIW